METVYTIQFAVFSSKPGYWLTHTFPSPDNLYSRRLTEKPVGESHCSSRLDGKLSTPLSIATRTYFGIVTVLNAIWEAIALDPTNNECSNEQNHAS